MTSPSRILALPDSGAHIVTGTDGRHRVRLRTGRFAHISAPSTGLTDALAQRAALANPTGPAADFFERLTVEVNEREMADQLRRWPPERRAVCLFGTSPLLDEVARALAAWGAEVARLDPLAEVPDDAAIVIAYADDAHERRRWAEFDLLPRRGVTWLRVYRDGECVLVDPLALDEADPTSAQVSARRAAASSAPASAEAWQSEAPSAQVPVDDATRVLVVARLVHTVLAWVHEDPSRERLRTTLWKLVPATGIVSEHTVLPFPAAPARVIR